MPETKTQSSLIDIPRPGNNMPEFSVSEVSKLLKKTVEETFGQLKVRGEISGLKVAPSGHVYFDLKDEDALLASVCWKGQAGKLGLKLESGMDVVCTGRLTTYMLRSNYQLVVEQVSLAGMGALLKMLEERKKKLAGEGLFDPARKQLLPFLPNVIGVITSPTGAVIRDILHRLADRFPRHVLVWPVAVQGASAPEQIAAAISGFNALPHHGSPPRPDVLIVARGGGSVEDLMAFNEEIVVRAAAASDIPLISAVGHETDTTLIDFAADVRAPTPTAAAEMAVPVRHDLLSQILDDDQRLLTSIHNRLVEKRDRLSLVSQALGDPSRALEPLMQRFDEKSERLNLAWQGYFERRRSWLAENSGKLRHPRYLLQLGVERLLNSERRINAAWREDFLRRQNRLDTLGTVLGHLSPRAVLGRGYTLIQSTDGRVITHRDQAKNNEAITIEFQDGTRGAIIKD